MLHMLPHNCFWGEAKQKRFCLKIQIKGKSLFGQWYHMLHNKANLKTLWWNRAQREVSRKIELVRSEIDCGVWFEYGFLLFTEISKQKRWHYNSTAFLNFKLDHALVIEAVNVGVAMDATHGGRRVDGLYLERSDELLSNKQIAVLGYHDIFKVCVLNSSRTKLIWMLHQIILV